ncbi:unnamed protein product [Peronospora destructor]|uniref:Uncharacterized protein n=1 Tax=Peronospora destructor TaxID=86335 RepID=A0AAV0TG07_9STRA|nr:unnamed protein product [Peronospora destructor]
MTTSGNSNTTLLLVTGLLSVGMAAIGYYYLQMNSKKPHALTNDSNEAGVYNSQKTSTVASMTEEEKIARVKSTVSGIQTNVAGTSFSSVSKTTGKTIAASVGETIEKTVVTEMPTLPSVSSKKALESPKTTVKKVVEPPVKVVESSVVVEASKEVISCPKKTTKSSPKKTVGNLKNEIEPPVLVLSKPFNTSSKKASGNLKKIAENPKQTIESQNKVVEQATVATIESSKKATGSPKKAAESPKKAAESLKQAAESAKKVVEQTEALTIEHPKQTPASPSKKKIAGLEKSTEPASATEKRKSVTSKVSEDVIAEQAIAETASAFANKALQEMLDNIALEQDYIQVDLTQSMTLSQNTPELINIEDAVVETEEVVPTFAATEDKESNVKEEQEQEQNEELARVSSGSIKLASAELVIDTATTTETLASPKTPDTTPVSWEAIILSPEMEAAPVQESTTPLSLDATAESTESTEPLSIHVPAENNEELAEDKNAISPVDSGGSTPGKRNRNRSKKSKSKKKKGKKH